MSKLFKFKQWLSLADAAKHLSGVLQEEVTEADLLKLALNDHIRLSIYTTDLMWAKVGIKAFDPESKRKKFLDDPASRAAIKTEDQANDYTIEYALSKLPLNEEEIITFDGFLKDGFGPFINECLDLLLIFHGHSYLMDRYLALSNMSRPSLGDKGGCKFGIFLQTSKDEGDYILWVHQVIDESLPKEFRYTPSNMTPSSTLPASCFLVIRTEVLREFEESIFNQNKPSRKDIDPKTRNKLLDLVKALAQGLVPNLDEIISSPHKAATAIDLCLSKKGIDLPVSKDTLANYLAEANK